MLHCYTSGVVDDLFGSKTRVKLLRLFYGNPNRSFYVREITRKIEEQINSVRRELSNLLQIGIIVSDTNNNKLYYEVDQKFPFYGPLEQIFGRPRSGQVTPKRVRVAKQGASSSDEDAIALLGNIELALYTGRFTRDESSDIDFLVVGSVNQNKLAKLVEELEAKEGYEIRYALLSHDDFEYRRQINDRFINNVMHAKKQVIIDKNGILEE